ncbi:FAD-dependent oxidoreductase [Streptomyces sp. GC420]|uniref:NAD(P)/FAD-dependent oxidoreductase n=1 Tax=Streptomyces sp. GC420 TaxID=2697568 RepID=UPI001414FF89|nr:FAD-dependent oxidoreductase [Streptomyces sp. GC420]NBM14185.1 FAD-dependent oxidoreductase [Streptomyces sp. GC420]
MSEILPRTIAIVGTGVAGTTAALTLRKEGFGGRIVLIGDEPEEPYQRPPLSKNMLRHSARPEAARLKPTSTWAEQDIELLTGTKVTGLDADALRLADGSQLPYDRLLLATGGRARTLPQAVGLDHVHTLRTLGDVAALRADLQPGGPLLVVGAGLVGLEVAATARAMGCQVTVLESSLQPLGRVLPARLRQEVMELHRAHGVRIHTDVRLERLDRHGDTLVATDHEGTLWEAQTVLVAVGMTPETTLARQAGLDLADGIVVDAYGTTSAPHIYAAGDVACHPDAILRQRVRIEQWNHAQEHGAAVAVNMLPGNHRPYDAVPWGWTNQYGVNLQICGHPAQADELIVQGGLTDFDFAAAAYRSGRLIGGIAAGRPVDFRALRRLVAEHSRDDGLLTAETDRGACP